MIAMIRDFLRLETTAGFVLVLAAAVAMVVANSGWSGQYEAWLAAKVSFGIAPLALSKTTLHWINDGLMAIFFLLVGLEIKREMLRGELSTRESMALPVVAAIGGMVAPAAVYLALSMGDAEAVNGWPVPVATDIAFALGVLALVSNRIPAGLRVFLLGMAIIDDLGAIILIALLFTADLSTLALSLGAVCVASLLAMNRLGVTRLLPYLAVGLLLWLCVLKSGVHATLAGVVTGLAIPIASRKQPSESPLETLEHAIHPWVAYLILPVFAFANAGVSLDGIGAGTLQSPIVMGIAAGLFLGKQLGVFAACWVAVRLGLASLPSGATWRQLYGVAILTGIGFTMSLFIGSLAFEPGTHDAAIRIGVLTGSLLSAVVGCAWLALLKPHREPESSSG